MDENFQIRVPQMGEGLHFAKVVRVLKSPGDRVEEDADVVEVETEKAILSISSPVSGFVTGVSCRVGDMVNVGEVLLEIGRQAAAPVIAPQVRKGERAGVQRSPAATAGRTLPEKQLALIRHMRASRDIVVPASLEFRVDWAPIDAIKRASRSGGAADVPSSFEIICWSVARAMQKFEKFRARLTPENELYVSTASQIGMAVAGDDDVLDMRTVVIEPAEAWPEARSKIGKALRSDAAGYHSVAISDMSAFRILRAQPVVIYPAVATLFIGAPDRAEGRGTAFSTFVLTFDHRVLNGVYAAHFLKQVDAGIRQLAAYLCSTPERMEDHGATVAKFGT